MEIINGNMDDNLNEYTQKEVDCSLFGEELPDNMKESMKRDIAILSRLKKEEKKNLDKILSSVRRRFYSRIFIRVAASCAAIVVIALFVNYMQDSSNTIDNKNIIASADRPVLIDESGGYITLDNENSYTLEYAAAGASADGNQNNGAVSGKIGGNKLVTTESTGNLSGNKAAKESGHVSNNTGGNAVAVSKNTVIIPNGYTYNIKFDDGTEAFINSGSYIEYPKSFAARQKRIVELSGEGYFKVAKSDKPFIVKTNGLEITVYGTEFNVNTNKEGRVETLLVCGSVGIKGKEMPQEILLEPNELMVYSTSDGSMQKQSVEPSDYLAWMQGDFSYSSKPLADLLDELCAFYGIEIERDEVLDDMQVTISLSRKLGFRQIMEIMEPAFGLEFRQIESKKYKLTYK